MKSASSKRLVFLGMVMVLGFGGGEAAKPPEISGAIAASCGEVVVLLDPASGQLRSVETGPVGFLFPGPGGVLFAPDVINGRTTVYDMRSAKVKEIVDGVTMPHFGPWRDRYLVVAGNLIVVSYPERSFMLQMEGDFLRPWQVIQAPDTSAILLLERYKSGEFASRLSALDLIRRSTVMQREFAADLVRISVLGAANLLAAVDASSNRVRMLDPATFKDMVELDYSGNPTDVAVLDGGRQLVVAGDEGALQRWSFKQGRKELKTKSLDAIAIEGKAIRLAAAPDDRLLAAATDQGMIVVVDTKKGEKLGSWPYEGELRDLIWFDPTAPGPLIPTWSDQGGGPETVEKKKW